MPKTIVDPDTNDLVLELREAKAALSAHAFGPDAPIIFLLERAATRFEALDSRLEKALQQAAIARKMVV